MDWIPLIGNWALGFQIAALTLIALTGYLLWVTGGDDFGFIGLMSLTLIGFVAIAGFATETQSPVPQSNVQVAGAENMDRATFRIRSGDRVANLVLLGQRDKDTFRVLGFRERIRGGEITDHREWNITALPVQSRGWGGDVNVSVFGETPIRANGTWQEGEVSQQAVFARGETYSLYYWFGRETKSVRIPVSF